MSGTDQLTIEIRASEAAFASYLEALLEGSAALRLIREDQGADRLRTMRRLLHSALSNHETTRVLWLA